MRLPIQVEVIPYRYMPDFNCIGRGVLEILALHRVPEKGGFWQPVTGGLERTDKDESAAALREIIEELGVIPESVITLRGIGYEFEFTNFAGQQLTEKVFAAELTPSTSINLSDEHDDLRWGLPPAIRELYEWEDNKYALDLLVHHLEAAPTSP